MFLFSNYIFNEHCRPKLTANVFVYELWRVSAPTFPDKNWLWKIRRIFQVRTDQAIAYIPCCATFFISTRLSVSSNRDIFRINSFNLL